MIRRSPPLSSNSFSHPDVTPVALMFIKNLLENDFNCKFNYCLSHLYRNGDDKIDRHSDKEALNNPIASLSFGATRKFRFQRKGVTSGWEKEFELNGGDLLIMKVGCQQIYEHWIPVEKKVKEPRINLTFRFNN